MSLKQGRNGMSRNYKEEKLEFDGREQECAEMAEPRDMAFKVGMN